jgi:hypothetical protein
MTLGRKSVTKSNMELNEYQKEVLEAALHYQKLGLSVIPLDPGEKTPLIVWKGYQKRVATPQEIQKWVEENPSLNIGIVTGAISGIAVVDVDKGGDASIYPDTPTVKTGSGNGWHKYYSVPLGIALRNSVRKRDRTDVRAEGGYVVAPPSILKSGKSYVWTDALENISDLTPFPMHMFAAQEKSQEKPDWMSLSSEGVAEGSRNDSATRYAGGLLSKIPQELWKTAGWGGLRELNATFKPPLTETELRQVFESIVTRELSKPYKSRSEVEDESLEFKLFSLSELYDEDLPPTRWIAKDLIPLGGITAITGDSNSYKSFLTQSLAMSVIEGNPFLGHFPITTRGRVLVIDEENHRGIIRKRFKDLRAKASNDLKFISQAGFYLDKERSIEKLRAAVDTFKPTLIILDSLVDMHAKNENDSVEMNSLFSTLRREIVTADSTIIVIHHHRKPQMGNSSRPGQNMRGASGIRGAIDAHIAVDRKEAKELVVTQDKLREQEQLKPFKVSIVTDSERHVSFVYQGEDTSRSDALLKVQKAIADALFDKQGSMTYDDLHASTGIAKIRLREGMADLTDTGEVIRIQNADRGAHQFILPIFNVVLPEPTTTQAQIAGTVSARV